MIAQNALLVSSSVQPFSSVALHIVVTSAWAITLAVNCSALTFSVLLLAYLVSLPKHNGHHMASFLEATGGWLVVPALGTIAGAAMLPIAMIVHVLFTYMAEARWEMVNRWAFVALAINVFIVIITVMLARAARKIGTVTKEAASVAMKRAAAAVVARPAVASSTSSASTRAASRHPRRAASLTRSSQPTSA